VPGRSEPEFELDELVGGVCVDDGDDASEPDEVEPPVELGALIEPELLDGLELSGTLELLVSEPVPGYAEEPVPEAAPVPEEVESLPVVDPGAPSVSELVPELVPEPEVPESAVPAPLAVGSGVPAPVAPVPAAPLDGSVAPVASAVRVRLPYRAYHASNSACSTLPSLFTSADAKLGSRPSCAAASAAVTLPSPSVSSVANESVADSEASAANANTLATAPARDAAAYFIVGLLSERMR
jgi:hypothetical protein